MSEESLKTIVFTLIGVAIIREVLCWYWKVNAIVANQKKQNELLDSIQKTVGSVGDSVNKLAASIDAAPKTPEALGRQSSQA